MGGGIKLLLKNLGGGTPMDSLFIYMLGHTVNTCCIILYPPPPKKKKGGYFLGGPPSNIFAIWSKSMRFGGVLDMVNGLFFFCMLQKFLPSRSPKMPFGKHFGPHLALFQGVKKNFLSKIPKVS